MYKLIIIDDEDEIRCGLKNYYPWHDVGFEVAADFSNAQDALDYLCSHTVHVAMTDIRMPEISGIDFISAAKKHSPSTNFVILSGYRDFDYARQAMLLGVKYYLVKPTKYAQITEVFSSIRQELIQSSPSTGQSLLTNTEEASAEDDNHTIRQIKQFIKSSYASASLESVAQHVRMNPYYLSSYFHNQTGEKFYDYLMRVRMREAARLLCQSDLQVNEIGERVGYSTSNSFSRSFRAYYQLSPKNYRKLHSSAYKKENHHET